MVDAEEELSAGTYLTGVDADAHERLLRRTPDDLSTRIRLLGYYSRAAWISETVASHRARHVLWLIENSPWADVVGLSCHLSGEDELAGAEIWQRHLSRHPEDPRILVHAARFLQYSNPQYAKDLIVRAQALAPQDHWTLDADSEREPLACLTDNSSRAALQSREIYDSVTSRFTELKRRMMHALGEGNMNDAMASAIEMLNVGAAGGVDWPLYGDSIHIGHHTIGRVGLANGDILSARRHLLEAGQTVGSAVLGSFGPNMTLAHELVAVGERDVVKVFLKACHGFWLSGHLLLDVWIRDLDEGRIPNFRQRMDYNPKRRRGG